MGNNDTILSWVGQQLAIWQVDPVEWTKAEEPWHWLNDTHPEIFLCRFQSGSVHVVRKPRNIGVTDWHLVRVAHYLRFFEEVSDFLPPGYEATLALAIGDNNQLEIGAPIFSFQKRRGGREVLLPDIDFLTHDFYRGPEHRDDQPFTDKSDRAIFVGSTTGGTITPEIARTCGLPRLAAARFFTGSSRVEFTLPSIVQCSNVEARQILEQMEFCRQPRLSWREQLKRKCLISIDGNGAACSRVVLALKSNSALLKYESDHLLYYFNGLKPRTHYIPIKSESDVEDAVDLVAAAPAVGLSIAREGRVFAETYLTKEAVTNYMVQLLLAYRDCFTGSGPSFDRPSLQRAGVARQLHSHRIKARLQRRFLAWLKR
jgi:hypothetical protein